MCRAFLLFLLLALPSGGAFAFDPEGATAEMTNFGGLQGFSLGVFGVDTSRTARPVEDNLLQIKAAALEASWSHGGFLIALSAGRRSYMQFTLSSLSEWSANFTSVRLHQEIATVAGGTVAAGFGAYLYESEGDTWRVLNFSLGWSRRF